MREIKNKIPSHETDQSPVDLFCLCKSMALFGHTFILVCTRALTRCIFLGRKRWIFLSVENIRIADCWGNSSFHHHFCECTHLCKIHRAQDYTVVVATDLFRSSKCSDHAVSDGESITDTSALDHRILMFWYFLLYYLYLYEHALRKKIEQEHHIGYRRSVEIKICTKYDPPSIMKADFFMRKNMRGSLEKK